MKRLSTPEGLARHGFTLQGIKEWRKKEYDAGRPSGIDDFFRAHGLCVKCRGERTLVVGIRRRDADGVERAEKGPSMGLVEKYSLENPTNWLNETRKWDYLYETCHVCGGNGKYPSPEHPNLPSAD